MTAAQYIVGLRQDMRAALLEFRKFDNKWNSLNSALDKKFMLEGRDMIVIAQAKEANLTLQGYMSAAMWWRDKAQALATIILAEQAADDMLEQT
jgi:hypothetical protein